MNFNLKLFRFFFFFFFTSHRNKAIDHSDRDSLSLRSPSLWQETAEPEMCFSPLKRIQIFLSNTAHLKALVLFSMEKKGRRELYQLLITA